MFKSVFLAAMLFYLAAAYTYGEDISVTQFQYLSNLERSHHTGDRIKFMNGDILQEWVHSNDQIAIMQSPVFYGLVTTSASDFWRGASYNPQFLGPPPVFNYPWLYFPGHLQRFRQQASLHSNPGYNFAVIFKGLQGYEIVQWPASSGAAYHPANPNNFVQRCAVPLNEAHFFESDLYVSAREGFIDYGVAGTITLGCSGNLWLMDNIRYVDSDPLTGAVSDSTPHALGLLSESNILIMNTWANGRCNGRFRTNSNPDSSDIIINGALFALNGCFSFEDQHDNPNNPGAYPPNLPEWYFSMPPGPNGPPPYNQTRDERGIIYLWGSIAQFRRGYVHRSNYGGTGYLKDFNYYQRIRQYPPPYYPTLIPELTFSDSLLDFGHTPINNIAELEVNITFNSRDSIHVFEYYIDNNFFTTDFQDTGYFHSYDTLTGLVFFRPELLGIEIGNLGVITDRGSFSLLLRGEGIYQTDVIDKYNRPIELKLQGVSPNPFNSSVTLKFTSSRPGKARFEVFDITGRTVYASVIEYYTGQNRAAWVPLTEPSGIYFYRLADGKSVWTGKLVYMK